MNDFQLHRMGMLMEPLPGDQRETEGTLNPAAARGADGHLYLFPRLVAKGNYSRIGIARVKFDEAGDPVGVERMGIALEPEAEYERRADGGGGCEDPRITFVEPLERYIMTYTAYSSAGPRIALAQSTDLLHWERIGLATFGKCQGLEFDGVDNKDASVFPEAIADPLGRPALAMLHRPLFAGSLPEEKRRRPANYAANIPRESIWISYCHLGEDGSELAHPCHFASHRRLASPIASWEQLKIGGGTPPVRTCHGWMIVYHGVSEVARAIAGGRKLRYSAGVMILAGGHPHLICYRSEQPVLTPDLAMETQGTVANVVFPTGIDQRRDLGDPNRFDIYYGMADNRIGAARLDVPELLPEGTRAISPLESELENA